MTDEERKRLGDALQKALKAILPILEERAKQAEVTSLLNSITLPSPAIHLPGTVELVGGIEDGRLIKTNGSPVFKVPIIDPVDVTQYRISNEPITLRPRKCREFERGRNGNYYLKGSK